MAKENEKKVTEGMTEEEIKQLIADKEKAEQEAKALEEAMEAARKEAEEAKAALAEKEAAEKLKEQEQASASSVTEEEERVEYVLPKNLLSTDKHYPVILNGKIYQVECGKRVTVPKGVAEILDNAIAQKEKAEELAAKAQ